MLLLEINFILSYLISVPLTITLTQILTQTVGLKLYYKGPFKRYVTQMGVGCVRFSGKKRYEGVRFNVISVTRGWVGVQFPEKSVT